MKQIVRSIEEVVLSQNDIKDAAFSLIKDDEQVMETAIRKYILANLGSNMKELQVTKVKDELVATALIDNNGKSVSKPTPTKPKGQFERKNVGFYKFLIEYLKGMKKKGEKNVPKDATLKALQKSLPNLDSRNFDVYIRDKREWAKKGFSYNSDSRTLSVKG